VPIFTFQIARGITLMAGVTREPVPGLGQLKEQACKLGQAQERIRQQERQIRRLREKKRQIDRPKSAGVRPDNLVWILGTPRVGSTWLGAMMASLKRHRLWHEPLVGRLFGYFFYHLGIQWDEWPEVYRSSGFIFSPSHKETWLNSIRSFVIDGANARAPRISRNGYVVIQEPNGSIGAPWLLEALPESRLVFLVRDPRDVVASMLDAYRKGGWLHAEQHVLNPYGPHEEKWLGSLADTNANAFVERAADRYLRDVSTVKQGYDFHEGPKVIVRYEDLRADTLRTMKRIYSALGISVDEDELGRVVEEHAWHNIPEEFKGKGKLWRKATPSGWREDLSPEQAAAVERITAPLLEEFYAKGGE
jgi:Sulfotransferase family